jgi:membrane protein required for colicin V production
LPRWVPGVAARGCIRDRLKPDMTAPAAGSTTIASFTAFDWLLVCTVAISALMAFRRGFIRVLFSLAGLIAGILFASWNYLRLATWMHRWVTSLPAAQIIAFLTIILAVWFVFATAAGFVRRAAKAVGLGFADRLLGAAFGVARGVLLGIAAMMVLAAFVPESGWIKKSVLAPYFLEGAHAVSFVVPRHFEAQMSDGARHLLKRNAEALRRSAAAQ